MSQAIEITDEDIKYAEDILLPQGKAFDDERRNFIRNLSTIDLQAVPGSGKTTALLAKLLILETKLPLSNGSGVLVLSHTNAAVDEIKKRIHQYCPKLFRYPNFIGTIQSFVNEFLAIPYYLFRLKKKPLRIDNEIYAEQIEFSLSYNTKIALSKRGINYIDILSNSFINNEGIFKHFWSNGEVNIPKIGSHTKTYKELATIKINLLKTGILSFYDCYALAQKYLSNYPIIHKIINKRFQYVFIDEMQDMDTHQYELIEKIFTENNDTNTIIQRIGDKNQSIYNSIKAESIWQDRDNVLHLSNSQRLSRPIANIVKNFALYPEHCTDIQGMNECQLKPHILLFTDSSIKNVIPHFSQLVQQYKGSGELNFRQDKPLEIKVISWNTDWKDNETSRSNPTKVRLEDYHQAFKKNDQKPKEDYKCLKSYIYFYDKKYTTLSIIRKNIFHALLKILRIENISTNENRLYTISNLINHLKLNSELNYADLNLKVYQCCLKVIRNEKNQALSDLQTYIPVFISYFKENHRLSSKCSDFIYNDKTGLDQSNQNHSSVSNMFEENNLKIEITSVHSVKGQTHDATLYLESYYYEDGKGRDAKSYESQRLANQFLGNPFNLTTERAKQSTKMAYVGFSRATQLLCIAIHKDRFEQYLNTIDRDIWVIKDISV
ncbi:DNA helicase-2/ATP-dependent DNA helicase PcrA [Acinetobacter baylyi]|uniref:DNA 3'-5' helicase II n=2 Tax=Acinetobacter baylyi TaxID=202950 RepID=A0ABU0USC3_ACIBI|nr:UvrD-helicase domain-containing protein [Acinetobacter baylyi]MDQ1207203.1 DNA helicase-2/ATP-dependent DNA helicase PcrA [Acinetobacter baylyi]MDR6105715.1 DNA helicase-2/ATP-dependent DNA helicase PcrA [Acinetobacter baylyi]